MSRAPPLHAIRDRHGPATTLYVTEDDRRAGVVESAIAPRDGLDHERVPTARPALRRLEEADCLVFRAGHTTDDGTDLLSAVRDRAPALPVVVLVEDPEDGTLETVGATPWTDFVLAETVDTRRRALVHRVRLLVRKRRVAALARRALAAVETLPDGVATTGPDGRFTSVDTLFAARFDYDRDELIGRDWRTLFAGTAIERIESKALPSLDDAWSWSGACTGLDANGSTFRTDLTLVGLDDGSHVFVVPAGSRIRRA